MYIVEFFKNLTKKSNIGVGIYLVLNVALIIFMFGGFKSISGFLLGISIYLVSLGIALSPVGEAILRWQTGCKTIKRQEDIEKITPLFEDVYKKAKTISPQLPDDIKIYMCDDEDPNAFATGRKTICITKGFLYYGDEEIKATLAHEFGHLAKKDTDIILLVSVGNLIVNITFFTIKILVSFVTIFLGKSAEDIKLGVIINVILFLAMKLWTRIGVLLCMHSSRLNEYEADEYAMKCGYGEQLCTVLDEIDSSGNQRKGLWSALTSSHPNSNSRIANLQQLGCMYRNV